jgi:hypothetical protein
VVLPPGAADEPGDAETLARAEGAVMALCEAAERHLGAAG